MQTTKLAEVKIITPKIFTDARGFFFESYQLQHYHEFGITKEFVQDNFSRSCYGALRGLHYQLHFPQAKLITVTRGKIFDVVVDLRKKSPTFAQWKSVILSEKNCYQIYIPAGFAHGFCVLSETADIYYKCTDYYHPEDEHGIIWNDPTLAIAWPQLSIAPLVSAKDTANMLLSNIKNELLPEM